MPFTDAELISWLPSIRKISKSISHTESEELYSRSLLRLMEKRDQVHHRDELFVIVRNQWSDLNRKWGRMFPTDPANFCNLVDAFDLEDRMYYQQVCKIIDKLPAYQREVIECAALGMRYDEIGEKLKIPVGTVRSRLTRARTALRRKLDG